MINEGIGDIFLEMEVFMVDLVIFYLWSKFYIF